MALQLHDLRSVTGDVMMKISKLWLTVLCGLFLCSPFGAYADNRAERSEEGTLNAVTDRAPKMKLPPGVVKLVQDLGVLGELLPLEVTPRKPDVPDALNMRVVTRPLGRGSYGVALVANF